MERRTFIIGAVAGGIGLVEYVVVSGYMNSFRNPRGFSVKALEASGERAALLAITPNEDFYVTTKGGTPRLHATEWKLTFDGLVSHPFTLTYNELLALPQIEKELTLECISNPVGGNFVSNANWMGTALKPLIERAGPLKEAAHAIIYADDGYSTGHPLSRLWNEENFLAYRMNGEVLPQAHGYPARIFIPGKYGMKQPKWVTRVQFADKAHLGYWESRGWSDSCERLAHARFTDLKDGAKIYGKNVEFTGYALGNLDGVKSVELSFDDGESWQATNVFSKPSPLTWIFWKYIWIDPRPGTYHLRLRAVDGMGRAQEREPQGIFPDGATGQQALRVTVI